MKKLLFIIVLIISLFGLSCKNNSSSSIGKIGEIVVNPNGVTPLSAVYTTATVNVTPITVKVKGLYGEPDIIHTYPAGYGTEFEIHGMFAESENTIEVNDGGRIITKNVSVESLPNGLQKKYDVEINNLPEEKYTNNPELYFLVGPSIGISRNGYVRYIANGVYSSKLYIDKKKFVIYPTSHNNIHNMLGKSLIKTPSIAHHDMIKINNNYVYLSLSSFGSQDRMVIMDSSGKEKKVYSFGKLIENSVDFDKHAEDRAVFEKIVFGEDVNNIYIVGGEQKSVDWFHVNSIVYDSATDILYVSSRHRGVLAINYSEWKLIWWMADDKLSTRVPGYIPYNIHFKDLKSLEPYRVEGDGMNDGPKNQHALFLLANGNLGMFDNQGDDDTNPNGSRYVEYRITGAHGNYTAKKVYEYRNRSLYSHIVSDVDFTGEKHQNLLLAYGYKTARILEIEKTTQNVLFRLDLPFQTYRVEKMPLYYDEGRVYSEDCNLKNPN